MRVLYFVISIHIFITANGENKINFMLQDVFVNHVVSHLQCTTMGPASGGLQAFTRLRKARNGVGCSGTPWSGQAVNWNCLTSLFSLEPFWIWRRKRLVARHDLNQILVICRGVLVASTGQQNVPYFKKCKCPDTVCGQLDCVQQCHLDEAVCLRRPGRPVLVTFHLHWRETLFLTRSG